MANNVISFASSLSLAHLGFNAPTTKNAAMIFRVRRYYLTIPIILCCLGFMLPETDSKYMVITPCLTQLSVSFFEIVIMDQSRIPFWLYSFRHYVNLFYLTGLLICYFGVSNRAKRRLSHPH